MTNTTSTVPLSLRRWFVIHFAIDMLVGVPLLLAPEWLLPRLGWLFVDPVTSRLVGAAFMGIGIESLLGRNGGAEAFKAMLNLKIIWAGSAIFGLAMGLYMDGPPATLLFLVVFGGFLGVWVYYRRRLAAGE